MKLLRLLPAAAVLAGLAWLAWPRSAGRVDEELVLVSPHWDGIREEYSRAFESHYLEKTGRRIKLSWLDLGGTSKCLKYIRSGGAGSSQADLLFGGGVDPYIGLADDGYFLPVDIDAETLAAIPPTLGGYPLRDDGNRWFAACLASFGICFNREVYRRELAGKGVAEPAEWEDLADPLLYNWVGSGEPRSSGTVHMCFEMMLQSYGWRDGFALVTRMAGNVRAFNEGGAGVSRDVAMGQYAAGGSIDFYALEKVVRLGPDSLGYVVPRRLPVINGDPVAVLKGAPNRPAAEEFVRFVLSVRGQKLWYLAPGEPGGPAEFALGRLPVRRELCDLAGPQLARVNPFEMEGLGRWDSGKNGRRWRALNDLLGATVIEPHDELRAAWKALIDAGLPPRGVERFGRAPCTEDEFMKLADWFNDKTVPTSEKNEKIAKWGKWARDKYAGIIEEYQR